MNTSVRAGTVLLVTDLSIVQKTHRDGALLFVADAKSGAPAPRTHVVAKQFWYEGNSQHSAFSEGDSSAEGLLTIPLMRAPGRSNFRVQAVGMPEPSTDVTMVMPPVARTRNWLAAVDEITSPAVSAHTNAPSCSARACCPAAKLKLPLAVLL